MTTPFTGTGYTYVQSGSNYTITFDISGNITFTSNLFSVSYIVVGGGGGGGGISGGTNGGGGGGGGGVTLGSFNDTPNMQYTVTIGKGGIGSRDTSLRGVDGELSSLVSTTLNCVSSGGKGGNDSTLFGNSGTGGSSGSGGSGGSIGQIGTNGGGGGGGSNFQRGGNGSLNNNSNLYGGGGGGGTSSSSQSGGTGRGGGGNGANSNGTNVFDGVENTGGGGGGNGANTNGGNGGSGIVILFYYSAPETNLITYNQNTGINVDLNTIFTHYSGGIKAPQTNYTINGVDLNLIFDPISVGQSINFNTGYVVNGLDLRYIFNTPYYYVDRSSSSSGLNIRNFGYISQIDCSYDGKYCIAASVANGQYGAVFISSNTGQNWTALYPDGITSPTANPTSWQFCCCSNTGQIMIAGTTTKLYKSTNYGSNWSLIYTYTSSHNLRLCASNADCSRIYITTNMGPIICLNGSGTLYYNTPSGYNSNGITTNNTGQYVYYVTNGITNGNGVYYSSDYGQTFNKSTTSGNGVFNSWAAIKCDNSGKYVYASELNSRAIVYSNDFGVNYYYMINPNTITGSPSNDQGCYSITCDGTGNVVTFATFPMAVSTSDGGGVYQTKNALTNIINNTPGSITWSIIGNSTEFTQDSYWMSVTSDNNTGRLLVMDTAYEASISLNGGLYTYNMFK